MYQPGKALTRRDVATSHASSFTWFRRLLSYVWPQRRYVYPAIACILLVAFTYSASIGSILPVLYIMLQPEGLHGRAHQYIAEHRLDVELGIYSMLTDREVPGVSDGTARIRSLKEKSPLHQAGLRTLDLITEVNGKRALAPEVFDALAAPEAAVSLTVLRPDSGKTETAHVPLPTLGFKQAALGRAVSVLPGGSTAPDRMKTLATVFAGLMVIVIVGNAARLFAEYLAAVAIGRAVVDLRRQMYTHMFNLPLSRFSQNTSDTMSKYIQDMNDIVRGLENFFQKVITEPFKAIGVTILALYLNWRLTLGVMLVVPLAVWTFRVLGKKVRRANRKLLFGYGELLSVLESTLTGLRVVKGYMRENYERRRLFRIDRHLLRQQLKIAFIEALTPPFVETLGFFVGAAAMLYVAYSMFFHGMKPPEFMTMLVCLAGIFDPVRKLSTVYPKLQRANAAAERVFELIDSPSEYEQDAGRPRLAPLRDSIVFDNVTFTYPQANRQAVRNLSLTVRRGETIALVGPNGSGKTTLVSLLPRFFPITSGRILIDGQDTAQVSLRSLREQFCLITQESVIFPDTVRSNIAYGRRGATPEEIEEAARKAFADEFIQQMPQGYDTQIGEHGATLSGGQRQRIAIARAILRNAPILIFDEATSQVDPESELKIHQALEAFLRDRTAFVIAHRYATVSDADRIVVMEDGRLAAVGTHEHLLKTCPLYRRLYETQFRSESAALQEAEPDVPSEPEGSTVPASG